MTTNSDARREDARREDARREALTEADKQLVRPKVEFNALLKHAGATKDILSMREVMYYLGQYIMKKQLYDQTQQHIVHCSEDALGKVLGVESFSVKEPGPLFTMITKNLVPVRSQEPSNAPQHSHSQLVRPPEVKIQDPSNVPHQHYYHSQPDRPPDRPPEVKIQESSCLATQQHSQPARPPDGPPEDSDADSSHSTSGSRRRRRTSDPGPSHGDGDEEEEEDSEDSERKRRRADSYSLTFDNSLSWYVIADLRNGQDRVRHSSQSSDAHSYASNRSDHFSVEFEVESMDSDNGDDDIDDDTSLSDDDQVYEVTIYEDDDTDEDTEITEADYWRCLKCEELNPPLPRNCNRCWSLRQDWLPEVSVSTNPSTNPSPMPHPHSPGPDKSTSAEHPGVEEDGIDVPDGRRTTPSPCLSSQELSQTSIPPTYSQASTVSPPSSQNPSSIPISSLTSPAAVCAPSSSVHPPAADPGLDLCVICQSGPKNGCIVHGKTGHLMSCFRCARKLMRRNKVCPVCREPIQAVVKTFFC